MKESTRTVILATAIFGTIVGSSIGCTLYILDIIDKAQAEIEVRCKMDMEEKPVLLTPTPTPVIVPDSKPNLTEDGWEILHED